MSTLAPHQVLARELDLIRERRKGRHLTVPQPPGAAPAPPPPAPPRTTPDTRSVADVLADAHKTSSFGVAFSGGGIRSATFNLGVLQGLCEKGLLKHVDILSTVSGGGYIGSWLHALIRNHGDGQPVRIEEQLRASVGQPPGTPGTDPVMFLRSYSNYLAPRPGLFSSDTWTMVMIWVRNVLLNHLILAPALAALVAAALSAAFFHQHEPSGVRYWSVVVALVTLAAATRLLGRNLLPIARQSVQHAHVPAVPAAPPRQARRDAFVIVMFVLITAVALGAHPLATPDNWPRVALVALPFTIAMMVIVQWGGGFLGCYAARHPSSMPGWIHLLWMSPVCGAVGAFSFARLGAVISTWGATPWLVIIFGPALALGVIILSMMLLIGLMGADFPDAAREWTARIGSHLAIAAAAWTVLLSLALLGPWGLTALLSGFRGIGLTAIAAWFATAAGGALAGSSGQANGLEGGVTKRAVSWLTNIAPTVFLVGYIVFIATGVHMTLDLLSEPTLRAAVPLPSRQYDVAVRTPENASVEVRVEGTEPGWLASAFAPVDAFERGYPARLLNTDGTRLPQALALLGGFAVIALIASARININEFSLHHFYKNRLVRCYLGASNPDRLPNGVTGFDARDDFALTQLTPYATRPDNEPKRPYFGPYPLINTAVNINTGAELAQQERKAASFVFTPESCGFDPSTREVVVDTGVDPSPLGYRNTWGYAYPPGPNLGTAFAISGAAANPNWGYHTSGPVAFLLTVFNARLGWWLGNPRWSRPSRQDGPKASLWYLFAELLGLTSKRSKFVNLSDGGHFENLGLYELVRRRARFIIVCDAEEDGKLTFGSLGGVVRKVRADFGVEIDIDPAPIRRGGTGASGAHCVIGTISYPEDEPAFVAGLTGNITDLTAERRPRARGWLLYIKSSLTGDEPADVTEYQSAHAEFPHESTGDQFFSEAQFESYRRLGLHVLRSAFDGVTVDVDRPAPAATLADRYPLVALFQALSRRWYAPIQVTPEAATRLADAYVETMRRLAADQNLAALYAELVTPPPHPKTAMTPAMLAFAMDLFQLMQNVFTEFKLEGAFNQANPRNGGWIQVFYKWLQSDLLYNQIWPCLRNDYHAIFGQFVDGLHRNGVPDTPPRP